MKWLRKLFGMTATGSDSLSDSESLLAELKRRQSRVEAAGTVRGSHYTGHVEEVKQLKRERRHEEAIELLSELVDATERESKQAGWGVAPWYYEQLAIVYRKEGRAAEEIAILERYEAQPKAPGAGPDRLAERLEKARRRAEKTQ